MVLVCVGMQDCVAVVVIVSVYGGCCLGDAINIDPIPETAKPQRMHSLHRRNIRESKS